MIQVAALTSGRYVPSSRFRIRQHIQPLSGHGVVVREYCPSIAKNATLSFLPPRMRIRHVPPVIPLVFALEVAKFCSVLPGVLGSRRADVVWLERGLYAGLPTLESMLRKPLVLDVDDAVWHARPFGELQMKRTAERATMIVAGNSHLAEWFGRFNKNIVIVPTAIDVDTFIPIRRNEDQPFTLGWTGTSGNFKYLYRINKVLKDFFDYARDARMLVVADKFPYKLNVPLDKLEYVKWSEANEVAMVQKMDVGLMPLADDSWTRGKCSFKMLQYMACGKPVVVSPVGMNAEVLEKGSMGFGPTSEQDWLSALVELYKDRELGLSLGQNGRLVTERDYSITVISKNLSDIFLNVI